MEKLTPNNDESPYEDDERMRRRKAVIEFLSEELLELKPMRRVSEKDKESSKSNTLLNSILMFFLAMLGYLSTSRDWIIKNLINNSYLLGVIEAVFIIMVLYSFAQMGKIVLSK